MPDEVKNECDGTACNDRGREQESQQRNAQQKYDHRSGGENQSTGISVDRYLSRVNFGVGKGVFHVLSPLPRLGYKTGRASAVVPSIPPNPMVSTAEEGTMTIEPFSLIASYSMFMARRCSAMGLSA
jgi:hypothetical protein